MTPAGFGEGLGEAAFHLVETAEGLGVGASPGEVDGGDKEDLLLDVVEGEDLVEEHEAGVGDVELVGGEGGEFFDEADDVVGEEADGSGGEGRQAGEAGGGVAGEGALEFFEDVTLVGAGALPFPGGDGVAAGGHAFIGVDADEGVAADVLAAFYGFEEEGLGGVVGDAEEGGDGGFQVCGDGAENGDEGVGLRELLEGGFGGSVAEVIGGFRGSWSIR